MRSTSRRSTSPDRIAAVVSSWIRSRRDTGSGTSGALPPVGDAGGTDLSRSACLRSGVLLALGFLALALHAGLLIVLAATSLGEDPALLDLLVEAAQCAFERLVLAHSDFCQSRFTSSGRDLRALRRCRGQPGFNSRRSVAEAPERVKRAAGAAEPLPSGQWTRSSISSKRPSPASAIGTRSACAPTMAPSGTGASAS